jgi:hypothetical protein
MIELRERADNADAVDANDPIESTEPAEPTEPIDTADPIEPIESTDPRHPMQSTESSDHNDHFELMTPRSGRAALGSRRHLASPGSLASENLVNPPWRAAGQQVTRLRVYKNSLPRILSTPRCVDARIPGGGRVGTLFRRARALQR